MMRTLIVAAMMVGSALGARAQAPAASMMEPAKSFDALLRVFESEMMSAAEAMPADKYDFSPDSLKIAGAKFDGVRSFAGEVTHVTQANYGIYAGVLGKKPDVDVKAIGTLKDKDAIVKALTASFAYAHQAIGTLTVANENDVVRGGNDQTKASLAAYGAVHGFDHYGQMVEYLRMNGIVPPASVK